MTTKEVISYLLPLAENEEMKTYIHIHSKRFAYLIQKLKQLRQAIPDPQIRIMDIGPSFFSELLMHNFPNDEIYTMGFKSDEALGGHLSKKISQKLDKFIPFDLNDAQYQDRYVPVPDCKIVVMAEVLEHLYTSPVLVYRFISTFMDTGAYLVVGTPNAVTFRNRILMLFGKNPFELIRLIRENPGHYREYTGSELIQLGKEAGLETHQLFWANYFSACSSKGKMFDFFTSYFLPKKFRTGLTIIYRKS